MNEEEVIQLVQKCRIQPQQDFQLDQQVNPGNNLEQEKLQSCQYQIKVSNLIQNEDQRSFGEEKVQIQESTELDNQNLELQSLENSQSFNVEEYESLQKNYDNLAKENNELEEQIGQLNQQIQTDSQRKESNQKKEMETDCQIHINVLISNPLRSEKIQFRSMQVSFMPQLNQQNEKQVFIELFKDARQSIKYKLLAGNDLNFYKAIQDMPIVMHLSCHGKKDESNYLCLEDESGNAVKLDCKELDNRFKLTTKYEPELVFLTACSSENIVQNFIKNGAKHVIYIHEDALEMNDVVISFLKSFYEHFFICSQSVCSAFKRAKQVLENQGSFIKNNRELFILKRKDQKDHQCFPLLLEEGIPSLMSDVPKFRQIPARLEIFMGRERDIFEIIRLIRQHHLVTILGPSGIGKTAMAKEICNYLIHRCERNYLRDGIIYISCIGIDCIETLISKIAMKILEAENQSSNNKIKQQWQEVNAQKLVQYLNSKNMLFIFDNVEDIVVRQKESFHELLKEILQNNEQIYFLMTSRCAVGFTKDITEKHYTIKKLDEHEAFNFFSKKIQRILQSEEIIELLDKDYEENEKKKGSPLSQQEVFRLFRKHHFMNLLSGHPQSIALVSSLLQNGRRLVEVYNLLQNSLNIAKSINQQFDEKNNGTDISFIASMHLSIDTLQMQNKQAIEFFTIFGLLPSGATKETLSEI